jgi:hypothetical protein
MMPLTQQLNALSVTQYNVRCCPLTQPQEFSLSFTSDHTSRHTDDNQISTADINPENRASSYTP